jgi:hypothetical protein
LGIARTYDVVVEVNRVVVIISCITSSGDISSETVGVSLLDSRGGREVYNIIGTFFSVSSLSQLFLHHQHISSSSPEWNGRI